jgi:hypothetical protein
VKKIASIVDAVAASITEDALRVDLHIFNNWLIQFVLPLVKSQATSSIAQFNTALEKMETQYSEFFVARLQ